MSAKGSNSNKTTKPSIGGQQRPDETEEKKRDKTMNESKAPDESLSTRRIVNEDEKVTNQESDYPDIE